MPALSALAKQEYYSELGNALPPPVLDQPEYRRRRQITAVEAFEALHPADAYEARLAVDIVLAGAHAVESLREAGVFREDFAKRARCRAQAASLMREERATRRVLAQEQKVRLAAEAVANTATAQPAAAPPPPPPAEPQPESPPVQATAAAAAPPRVQATAAAAAPPRVQAIATAAAAAPQPVPAVPVPAPAPAAAPPRPAAAQAASSPVPAGSAPPPAPEAIAKAEAFVRQNATAAAQIRYDRGVTPQNKAYFRHLTLPTDPALIDALIRGTSHALTLLDAVGGEDLDKAA